MVDQCVARRQGAITERPARDDQGRDDQRPRENPIERVGGEDERQVEPARKGSEHRAGHREEIKEAKVGTVALGAHEERGDERRRTAERERER